MNRDKGLEIEIYILNLLMKKQNFIKWLFSKCYQ